MPYFIDTHDKTKGSFPAEEVTADGFVEMYREFDKALAAEGGTALGAFVNIKDAKAFCNTRGADAEMIRRAHEAVNFPFDSITEVRRVTGIDLR